MTFRFQDVHCALIWIGCQRIKGLSLSGLERLFQFLLDFHSMSGKSCLTTFCNVCVRGIICGFKVNHVIVQEHVILQSATDQNLCFQWRYDTFIVKCQFYKLRCRFLKKCNRSNKFLRMNNVVMELIEVLFLKFNFKILTRFFFSFVF